MNINRNRNVEQDAVKLFVGEVFGDNEDLNRDFNNRMNSRLNEGIYTVEDCKGIRIAASTHSSAWHPYCVYCCLAYDFNYVDEKAICFLIDALKADFEKPLFFLIDQRFDLLAELLIHKDFRMIRKTDIVKIEPTVHTFTNDACFKEIRPISQIVNEPALLSSLIELCEKVYTNTHLDNPVANLTGSSWKNAVMDELLMENSYVVLNGCHVIAFSLMYQSNEKSWELGWLGVESTKDLFLLDMMLAKQLNDAKEKAITYIEKEVDSTCLYSLHVLEALSYKVAETLYAFLEE